MAYDKIVAADDVTYQLPPLVRGAIEANIRNAATGEGDAVSDVADARITVARQNGILSPNYIINGAFEINQRNFTSSTTSLVRGYDRWLMANTGGTVTQSAQTFASTDFMATSQGARNYLRIVTSGQSAAIHNAFVVQTIENVSLLAGKTITISFWARAASGTPQVSVQVENQYNSTNYLRGTAQKVSLSTTWERKSVTLTVPSASGYTLDASNTTRTAVELWVSAGTDFNSATGSLGIQNNTFEFWGVQLEEGSVATPFRRNANSIQGELAACQRYYYRSTASAISSAFGSGQAFSATTYFAYISFPVNMRTAISTTLDWSGTLNDYRVLTNSGYTPTGITIPSDRIGSSGVTLNITSSGLTAGHGGIFIANSASAYLGFSAEL